MSNFLSRVDPELIDGLATFSSLDIPVDVDGLARFRDQLESTSEDSSVEVPTEVVGSTFVIAGRGGPLTLLVYSPPELQLTRPALIWAHGGGMISGSAKGEDGGCRQLSLDLNAVVVSVDYRLAPEHPFPAAVDDLYSALVWSTESCKQLRLDPDRIAVGGGSAGGGLAALLALAVRDQGGPPLVLQYLRYPMLDDRGETSSSREFSDIPSWNARNNAFAWECVRGGQGSRAAGERSWSAARHTRLAGLPPALIQVGELDVFRDESIDYASRLMQAGVPTDLTVYRGAYHGFDGAAPDSFAARSLTAQMVRVFQSAFAENGRVPGTSGGDPD